MDALSPDSFVDLAVLRSDSTAGTPSDPAREVLVLFDRCAPQLLRYVASLGLDAHETYMRLGTDPGGVVPDGASVPCLSLYARLRA